MTQFAVWLIEYCWVMWVVLVDILLICLFLVIFGTTDQKFVENKASIWVAPWWDVWNFYYYSLFRNLNRATRVFFQISWNEWHVLDIRVFFLYMSIIFVVFIY